MYIIFVLVSPWENSVSLLPNTTSVLATPVEWRKASALKGLFFFFPIACLPVFTTLTSCICVHPTASGLLLNIRSSDRIVSSALGSWVLGTNMRRILFVALAFVVLLHLIETAATRRIRGVEHPGAL